MVEKKLTLKSNKKIAIVYRIHSNEAVKVAKNLALKLRKKRYKVFTAPEQKLIPGTESLISSNDLKEMSLIVVLGGDGTYLRAVRLLKGHTVPILGFNMGHLGFLTAHTTGEVFETIDQTLKNEMVLHTRSRLHISVKFKNGKRVVHQALNDVVIERGSFSQLISTTVHFDKSFAGACGLDLEGNARSARPP